jgi:hypothetical protein
MSYGWDPREALSQVCEAASSAQPFPPPSSGRLVSDAIDMLKADGTASEEIASAEQLSVLLYRLEVATWPKDPGEVSRVREAMAACR